MKRYVIIGAGNSGLTCAKTIRKYDKNCEIVMISDENYPPYCRCLLTYYIEDKVDEKILFENNKKILKKFNINFIQGERVEYINSTLQKIKLRSGKEIEYDKLFLGIGGTPKISKFSNDNSILVTTLRKFDEAKIIKSHFKKGNTAVLEGGGLVSLKTLLALYEIGVKIYWVVKSPYILSFIIDRESAQIIEDFILEKGINLIKNAEIIEVKNKIVKISDGKEIKADGIIIGKGVKALQIPADKEFLFDDGFKVNEYMETNIENIFAGGDCTIVYDIPHETRRKVALWPVAGEHGYFAGLNMLGMKRKYKGSVQVNSFSVFANNIIAGGKKRIFDDEREKYYEVSFKKGKVFKKFILRRTDDSICGYVFINDIFKSGPFYYEIKGGGSYERNFNRY